MIRSPIFKIFKHQFNVIDIRKPMLEQAADALNRQDYQTAAKLIDTLTTERPDDPQIKLYAAQLQEGTNNLDRALEIYRAVLQQAVNIKITNEARQGIKRIEEIKAQIHAKAQADARAGIENNPEPGILVLEPMSPEQKQQVFHDFAAIMELDLYSAKLQLPTRGWRLYRLGAMGELEVYRQRLQQAGIPCFCVSQYQTQQMYVFRVSHFQHFHPKATIVCLDDSAELRTFNFNWSEVTQIVMGVLPIFEEVVEIDARNRTQRKTKTLDYIQVCDLQLRHRRSIFRLSSQTYNFCDYKQLITQNGSRFTGDLSSELSGELSGLLNGEPIPSTSRDNWKNLIAKIQEQVSTVPSHSNFASFAETAIGYPELLQNINPHIELLRRADSPWDRAFQLYSTLAMCKDN